MDFAILHHFPDISIYIDYENIVDFQATLSFFSSPFCVLSFLRAYP